VVIKLHNIRMVQFVHDLNFELDLLYQIMFDNFGLTDDFDSVNVLRNFVSDFIYFAKSTYSNIAVC